MTFEKAPFFVKVTNRITLVINRITSVNTD